MSKPKTKSKTSAVGVVGNRYYYTQTQIKQFKTILVMYAEIDYALGGLPTGCLKFTKKCIGNDVPQKAWKSFAECPKHQVPIFHIIFICTRGYYPLLMKQRDCGISHFCGAIHSNCGNPKDFRLELNATNRKRQDHDRDLSIKAKQRAMEKCKNKKVNKKQLRCSEHKEYPCLKRSGKQYLDDDFDILHYMQRQSRNLPVDFDDADYK